MSEFNTASNQNETKALVSRITLVNKGSVTTWEPTIPNYEEVGNLCDPIEVLNAEDLRSRNIALESLAKARMDDSSEMSAISLD